MATHKITGSRANRAAMALLAGLVAAFVTLGSVPVSVAQNDTSSFRDLATGSDFRVRVAAALALGKSKSPGARPALEKALSDPHPAVRSAAAAALGALGDAGALPVLRTAAGREADAGVKSQIEQTIKRLSGTAPQGKAKFLVSLGKLENKSGVTGPALLGALKASARSRIAQVPGVEVVADGTDAAAEGKSRNLPAFALDGSLTQLAKKQGSEGVGYAARVEFLIRKVPDQTLKGTMSGAAQALADAKQVKGTSELTQLQMDALDAAVDGALKNASSALAAAMR
ncbi:MAG: HEAT repeat domain-containing protein [Minicystis sp.]